MEPVITPVDAIPPASPNEALELERGELERFITVLETLPPDAWTLPVRNRSWDVHALVAHVAGSYAAQARFGELRRQTSPRLVRFYRMEGESLGDAIARIQIGDRRPHSAAQLIAELGDVGPRAIEHRAVVFRPLQLVGRALVGNRHFPVLPFAPFQAVRDLWFHRLDLTEATATAFFVDRQHDGRILELLIRSIAPQGTEALGERTVDLILSGAAGGRWRFGEQAEPAAVIEMGPIIFAKLISKQYSAAGIRERSRVDGAVRTAMSLLSAIRSVG